MQCLGEWAELNQDIQLEVTPEGQEEESFDHSWLFNKTDLADGPALIRWVCAQGTKAQQHSRHRLALWSMLHHHSRLHMYGMLVIT